MTDVSKLSTIVYIDYDALYWGQKTCSTVRRTLNR